MSLSVDETRKGHFFVVNLQISKLERKSEVLFYLLWQFYCHKHMHLLVCSSCLFFVLGFFCFWFFFPPLGSDREYKCVNVFKQPWIYMTIIYCCFQLLCFMLWITCLHKANLCKRHKKRKKKKKKMNSDELNISCIKAISKIDRQNLLKVSRICETVYDQGCF